MLNDKPCDDDCSCIESNSPQKRKIISKYRNKRQSNNKLKQNYQEEENLVFYQCFCDEEENGYPVRDEIWKISDVRRHWCLREHCYQWLFPVRYPSLELCSRLGRYLWHERGSNRGPEPGYLKHLTRCITGGMRTLLIQRPHVEKFVLCEQLVQADWLHWYARKSLVEGLIKYISGNEGMLMFSLEYARLARGEALGILLALAESSAPTIKRLYLWEAFAYDQNPVQEDISWRAHLKDTTSLDSKKRAQLLCCHYLSPFYKLKVLAINYAYIADITGKTILLLGSILRQTLRELQILCLPSEIPNIHKAWKDYRGYRIPDSAWLHVSKIAPLLRVSIVFAMLPYYDDVRMFLSKYIKLDQFILNSGLDMERKRTWGIDMIFKTLCHFYPSTLVRVSIELHRNREQMDPVIKNLPMQLPNMKIFEYTGVLHKADTMEYMAMTYTEPEQFTHFRRLTLKIQMSDLYTLNGLYSLFNKLQLKYPKLKERNPGLLHIGNKVIRLEIFPL